MLRIRNIRRGLLTRSRILATLGVQEWRTAAKIAENAGITSSTVHYHLKNMKREEIVDHDPKGRGWKIVSCQQTELSEYFPKKKSRQ